MHVTTHRLGRDHLAIADRVESVAEQAARLVARKVGPMVHVDLVVTDDLGAKTVIRSAEQELIGTTNRGGKGGRRQAGATTISRHGILIVINADTHRNIRQLEIDKTVVHELVHASQLSPDDARAEELRALRNNYRLQPMTRQEARAANRMVAGREREARHLERLANKIR